MKDIIEEVNVTKVYTLIKKISEKVKKFGRMEQEVFFNAMNKTNILIDPQLCDGIIGTGFKQKQPQLKQFMGVMKDKLMDKLKVLKEKDDE